MKQRQPAHIEFDVTYNTSKPGFLPATEWLADLTGSSLEKATKAILQARSGATWRMTRGQYGEFVVGAKRRGFAIVNPEVCAEGRPPAGDFTALDS